MHPKPVTTALLLLAACFGSTPAAGEVLTRGDAVGRALTQNPQVAASRAQETQARARQGQVEAARFPQLTVMLGAGPALKARLVADSAIQSTESAYGDLGFDDLTLAFGGRFELIQPLYTFGKIDKRHEAASHEIRARSAQTEMTRADVAMKVAELYETMLFARELERFFDDTAYRLTRILDDTKAALDTEPSVSEQDVLRLEAALGTVQLGLNQARAGVNQTRAGLIAYLGLPNDTDLQPKEATLEPLASLGPDGKALDQKALIARALEQRPELRALREGQAAFDKVAEAEQADNLPDVFAMAFVSGAYTPGRDLIDTRFYADPLNQLVPGALLGVRWQYQHGMANRRADVSRAQAAELGRTRDWASLGVPAEVTRALEDLRRSTADIAAAEPALQQAKAWMVRASADYGVGLGSSRDVTDAASAYAQLRIALLSAILRHNIALAELAKATGTLAAPGGQLYPNHSSPSSRGVDSGARIKDTPRPKVAGPQEG
jgi:outer membrane protein